MHSLRPLALAVVVSAACTSDSPGPGATTGAASASAGESTSTADVSTTTTTTTATSTSTGGSAGSTSASSSTGTGTDAPRGESSSTTDALDPFVHEVHTVLIDGRLALTSNLPPAVTECEALPFADPPCADADADGLVDVWEDAALDRLRPLRRMDEDESLFNDATAVIADVGRVINTPGGFRIFVMLGYSEDYGSCGGFTGHHGDSERVALDLVPYAEGGPGGVILQRAYTAAHEGTANDHSMLFAGSELGELTYSPDPITDEPRWVVFPSANKHATYASAAICEGISVIPCIDEDCAPDGVDDPGSYDLLPVVGNAGEAGAPRLTALDVLGFPGDDAWADQDFCGGLGPGTCSSPVREKLLADPF